jgi:hypothetical protein
LKATWRFRVVREDLTGIFIRRADGSRILHGTDAETLEFSRRVKQHFSQMALRMLQAPSIGAIDVKVPDSGCAREVAKLRPHRNCRNWTADRTGLHHGARHLSLEDAINYAAFRLRGHISEIRIFDRHNQLQAVILIDLTGAEPSANGPMVV